MEAGQLEVWVGSGRDTEHGEKEKKEAMEEG
jgi:hypothetical protein